MTDKLMTAEEFVAAEFNSLDSYHTRIAFDRESLARLIKQRDEAVANDALERVIEMLKVQREIYRSPNYSYPNGSLNDIVLTTAHIERVENLKTASKEAK